MNKTAAGLLLAGLGFAGAASAQDAILIRNGTIVTVSGPVIAGGSLLVRNGRIAKIGKGLEAPAGASIIEADGLYVYPGLIAPLTSIGLTGYPGAGNDTNETGLSTPFIDAGEGLNPEDETIEVTRLDGVTTVLSAPGTAGLINGRAAVIHLDGHLPGDMILKRDALVVFNTGARSSSGYPGTSMGAAAFIRDKLTKAREFRTRTPAAPPAKWDPESETLARVVAGEIPALFMTRDEVATRNALTLIEEFNLKGILFASGDILKFAGTLAERKIPVIWGGTTAMPERWEPVDKYYRVAAGLAGAGVLFAFNESPGAGSRNVRRQPVPAAQSVAFGLSEEDAVKALTINPARILGIDDRVGSLEEGKIADIVVCTKPIVQLSSRIRTVIINGRIVPADSVQTRLRDKYGKIVADRLKTTPENQRRRP